MISAPTPTPTTVPYPFPTLPGGTYPGFPPTTIAGDATAPAGVAGNHVSHAPWTPILNWLHHAAAAVAAHEAQILVLVLVAGVAAALFGVARYRNGHRALARRVRVLLVPTDTFDPDEEEIIGFARRIAQCRTPRPLLTPPWCRCVSFGWFLTPTGEVVFYVEVPEWMLKTLYGAIYEEVDIQPMSALDDLKGPTSGGATPPDTGTPGREDLPSAGVSVDAGDRPSGDAAGVYDDISVEGEDLNELVVAP